MNRWDYEMYAGNDEYYLMSHLNSFISKVCYEINHSRHEIERLEGLIKELKKAKEKEGRYSIIYKY
jgi:hypothetical protein